MVFTVDPVIAFKSYKNSSQISVFQRLISISISRLCTKFKYLLTSAFLPVLFFEPVADEVAEDDACAPPLPLPCPCAQLRAAMLTEADLRLARPSCWPLLVRRTLPPVA